MGNVCPCESTKGLKGGQATIVSASLPDIEARIGAILSKPILWIEGTDELPEESLPLLKDLAEVLKKEPSIGLKIEGCFPQAGGKYVQPKRLPQLALRRCRALRRSLEQEMMLNPPMAIGCKGATQGEVDQVTMMPCDPAEATRLDGEVQQEEQISPDVYGPFTTILFELQDGATKEIEFTSKPLGFEFNTTAPVIIKRVNPNSTAEERGVRSGMLMKAIDGMDLGGLKFKPIFAKLRKAVQDLPEDIAAAGQAQPQAAPQ